jgi:CheY-like chemotaxis protein
LTRLGQVLLNLLNNAAKYNCSNGSIRLRAERNGDEAIITIADTGIGIPPEMLAEIFEPYRQIENGDKNQHGGIGIGLSVAKKLVEMHGGGIAVNSGGIGKGSEFTVRLPLAAEQKPENLAEETDDAKPAAEKVAPRRILIVDDNEDAAEMLRVLLTMDDHETRVALNGKQALEIADEFQPEIALLDIGLPDMDGYEVARRLREKFPAARLIAISGWGQPEDRRRSAEAGFDFHLVKPVEFDELQKLIRF